MKKIIFILTILLSVSFSKNSSAIDTLATKYLPLQTGNIWVYNYSGNSSGMERLKITSTTVQNGHRYYIFLVEGTGTSCTCGIITYTPFLVQLQPIRIDSVNGNLMLLGTSCLWQINEHLLDSLASRLNCPFPDTTLNQCKLTSCCDTSDQIVFGGYRKTKTLRSPGYNTSYYRTYAMNIGLTQSWYGCLAIYYCQYTLLGCVINGILYGDTTYPPSEIIKISSEVPKEFSLYQNYPNPFNPTTKIKFDIAASPVPFKGGDQEVSLKIYDILGKQVASLIPPLRGGQEGLSLGTYEVEWDGSNYASGVYFYKLVSGDFFETKKLILLK